MWYNYAVNISGASHCTLSCLTKLIFFTSWLPSVNKPGSVMPHGVFFICNEAEMLKITAVSDNSPQFFQKSAADLSWAPLCSRYVSFLCFLRLPNVIQHFLCIIIIADKCVGTYVWCSFHCGIRSIVGVSLMPVFLSN